MVHRHVLLPSDTAQVHGIPATSPDRTLLDIASCASPEAVEEALDDALRRKILRLPRLQRRLSLEARSGRSGISVVRSLVADRVEGCVPQSVLETKLLRILRRGNLPTPVGQYEVKCGARSAFVDFAYPEERIAIEADGYRWHSGRRQWEHDIARRNALTKRGWLVMHVTWSSLQRDPQGVVDAIKDSIRSRRHGRASRT